MKYEKFLILFNKYLTTLLVKFRNKILSTWESLKNKYKIFFQITIAIASILFVYSLSLICLIPMNIIVKELLQFGIINFELASILGVIYILVMPAVIILAIFNKRSNREFFSKKYVLNNSEYYKCSFNIIFFFIGLILLTNQYFPLDDVNKIFFQNHSFWGIPLMTLFFRIMLDYYLLEEKELNKIL